MKREKPKAKYSIISRSVLFRMRNVSDRIFRENQNTHLKLNNMLLENRAVHEIMLINTVKPGRPQATVQYGARALHAGKLRLHPSTQNTQNVLLFHCNGDCRNRQQCYAIRAMPGCLGLVCLLTPRRHTQ